MANSSGIIAGHCLDAALAAILEKEQELARLDSVAGDGDHGAGMARGFRAAAAVDREGSAGDVLARAGAAFSDAAGGASGALVGMFIMMVGNGLQGGTVDAAKLHAALLIGVNAISKLGKAQVGDKTMLDTLVPFVTAFGEAVQQGASIDRAWQESLAAAEDGKESTRDMIARRGRSSVLKERSLGHLDPGAASMAYVLVAVNEVLQKELVRPNE